MSNIITINLNEWTTPILLAEKQGVSQQVINNWIRRGKVQRRVIEELNLILVRMRQPGESTLENTN